MTVKNQIGLLATAAVATVGIASAQAQDAAPAATPPATGWKSTAAAGLTLTRGNSDTLLATISANTQKKWDENEIAIEGDGTYGTTKINGVTTQNANSIHGSVQYNRLFTERLYGYAKLDGLHDEIADITYRVTVAPGAGYYFIKNKTTDLSAEAGPGLILEKLGGATQDYWTLRLAEAFHHEISDRARLWEKAEILPQVDHFKNYIVNAEIGVQADLTADKKLSLQVTLDDTYNNEPAPNRLKNDAKLIAAIAYKF